MKNSEKIKSFCDSASKFIGVPAPELICSPASWGACDSFSGTVCKSVSDIMQDDMDLVSFFKNADRNRKEDSHAPLVLDLGLIDYKRAFDFQKEIVSIKIKHREIPDIILLLEHPAVFTLGKRGGRENLVVPEEFLKSKDIIIVQTERGGNITFHGPGQLVLYPIIDLEGAKKGVADFVHDLEETMIQTSAYFGVESERNEKNHGVWVKNAKIGSIGLSIKRGISFHGLAFNVNMDLEPFSWINPCGMSDISMTSIKNELVKTENIFADKEETSAGKNKFLKAEGIHAGMTKNKIYGALPAPAPAPVSLPDMEQVKKMLLNNFFSITGFK